MAGGGMAISIDFNAEVAKFVSGVEHVNKTMDKFGENAKKHGEAGQNLFRKIVGAELVTEGIRRLADVVGETSRKLVEMVSHTIEADVKLSRLAQTIGVSVGELQGLQSAVQMGGDVDAETFAHGLEHMSASIAKAKTEAGPARDAIEHLGLSVSDLAGKDAKEQFLEVAEAIKKMQATAGTKFEIVDGLMGERIGKELVPALSLGREKLEELIGGADKAGVSLNGIDAAKVLQAGEATKELSRSFEGVSQQITVALAPIVTDIAHRIESFTASGTAMQAVFKEAFHDIALGIGYVLDGYQLLKIGVLAVTSAIALGVENLINSFAKLAEAIVWTANKAGANVKLPAWMDDLKTYAHAATESLWQQTKDAANAPWPHKEIDKWFNSAQTQANTTAKAVQDIKPSPSQVEDFYELSKAIKGLLIESRTKLDTFGMDELHKKINELKQRFGEIPEAFNRAFAEMEANNSAVAYLERLKTETEEVKKLIYGDSPFAKWQAELQKLNDVFDAGRINLDEYNAGLQKIGEEYTKAMEKKEEHHGREANAIMTRRFDFVMPGSKQADPAAADRKAMIQLQGRTATASEIAGRAMTNMAGMIKGVFRP